MITILVILAIIVAIFVLISMLSSKEMIIERNVTINKPLPEVFEFLKYTKNQDNFSVWNMTDPNMSKQYVGIDGDIGFIYKWDSSTNKNVGAGEQETKSIIHNKIIEFEVRFKRPMVNVAIAKFVVNTTPLNQTNVMWGFYSGTKFPMRLVKGIFVKMLGKDLDKGLQNLKTVLEK